MRGDSTRRFGGEGEGGVVWWWKVVLGFGSEGVAEEVELVLGSVLRRGWKARQG